MPVRRKSPREPAKAAKTVPAKVSNRVTELAEVDVPDDRNTMHVEPITSSPTGYIPVSHAYLVLIGISALWMFLLVGVYGWLLRTHDLTKIELLQEQIAANAKKDHDDIAALTSAVLDIRSDMGDRWTLNMMIKFSDELAKRNVKMDVPSPDSFRYDGDKRPPYLDPARIGTGSISPQSSYIRPY